MANSIGINETLLTSTTVFLFGRVLSDIELKHKDPLDEQRPLGQGSNNFLASQLRNREARLARIFIFAFEGQIYELSRPAIFLVHGDGEDPDAPLPQTSAQARLARSPGRIARTGVGRHFGSFSEDMRVWAYDKADLSLRMDIDTGRFEQILLDAEIAADQDGAWGSGFGRSSGGRSSGGRSSGGRSSGAMGRSSG